MIVISGQVCELYVPDSGRKSRIVRKNCMVDRYSGSFSLAATASRAFTELEKLERLAWLMAFPAF